MAMDLGKREAICYDSVYNEYYECQSGWYNWGRWVVFGIIVATVLLMFILFSCITARRRRRHGLQPYWGTGWAQAPPQYTQNYNPNQYQNPPPQYTPQGGYYGNSNQGYFGGQQNGVELQQPPNTYRGGENVYSPPAGPPPKKNNTSMA